MSPYWGVNFYEFFLVLISRIFRGDILHPTSDEVQIIVLSCIAISCGLLGPFLVLKKMAMFANSLSHTILLGIVIAFMIVGASPTFDVLHLFLGAFFACVLTCFFTEGLVKWFRLNEDASIGLVFTFLFALSIVFVTLFLKNVHLGVESVTGNADALCVQDARLAFLLVILNFLFVFVFYRHLFVCSFDKSFARILGFPCSVIHFSLLFMVGATCIGAFRAVGVLLVLAFLIGPYLTARICSFRLPNLIVYSCLIGILSSVCAVSFARHILSVYDLALSTGGLVVCFIGLFYFSVLGIFELRKKFKNDLVSVRKLKV